MNEILAIKNYILYLKNHCKLSVSIHSHTSNLLLKKELIVFNIHDNPYCICVKSCNEAYKHCCEKQIKISEKCQNGAFSGVCWAGVKEFVYPVMYEKSVIGFICVSGFASERGNEYLLAVSQKYGLPIEQLQTAYKTLKKEIPEKEYIDTLVYPLVAMLEWAHIKALATPQKEETQIRKIVLFIKKNYTQEITSETLCKEFGCSRSHLSKLFNEEMKTTLRDYITGLRVEAAKNLLLYGKLEISEIALSVGFNEAYYFTRIFKKYTGVTPLRYRKEGKTKP